MSTEPGEPVVAEQPTEPDDNSRQERVWLSAGALIGVIVAGLAIAVVVLTGNRGDGTSTGAPPTAGRTSGLNPGAAVAAVRDESLRAADEYLVVLNTLDYRNTADSLNKWESVASTPLLDELRAKRAETASAAEKSKTSTTAKLLFAAVSKISPDNNSTEVLAAVELTVNDPKGPPTVKQVRQRLTMIHIGDAWKVSGFTNVESPG